MSSGRREITFSHRGSSACGAAATRCPSTYRNPPATAASTSATDAHTHRLAGTANRVTDTPMPAAYRKELIWIVSSRPGPTPIAEIGAPDISSRALT